MKYLILDCGGVIAYPRLGDWTLPFRAAELLGPRARDLYTGKYLAAHRHCARWLDESRLVANVEEERVLRREYIREMSEQMGWNLSQADILRLGDDFTDNCQRYGFFEDVEPWLGRWKQRYGLGLLSDAMPSMLAFMNQRGLLKLFDAAVISTQVGALKPDPRMYNAICDALKAEPGDCLFVDDRICNLEGAVNAGMKAAQMARAAFLPDALWDGPVVHDFKELNGLIEA